MRKQVASFQQSRTFFFFSASIRSPSGHHPALYTLPVVFTASCAFLLPIDAISLITYSKGYYRMFDMLLPDLRLSLTVFAALPSTLMTIFTSPLNVLSERGIRKLS